MQHFDDSIALAVEPRQIAERLIESCEEFSHLQEAEPLLLMLASQRAIVLRGARCNAVVCLPRWQGPLGLVAAWLVAQFGAVQFDGAALDPDFILVFDAAVWSSLDAVGRDRLVFHELKHIQPQEDEFGVIRRSKETGKPLLKLVPHDTELFDDELVRYGVEVCNAEHTAHAIVEGEARKRRRGLKLA